MTGASLSKGKNMIILIISIIAIAVGISILVWINDDSILGILLIVFGVFTAITVGALLIFIPIGIKGEIRGYYALEATIENAREIETIENAALQLKIIEMNQWVAYSQYKRERFPSFYPADIEDLVPLK